MRIVFFFLLSLGFLHAGIFPVDIAPSTKDHLFMGIKILDQRQLVFQNINDVKFSEISDLAYCSKNQKLFMISDKGKLFIFKAKFGDKIEVLEPKDAVKLRKKNARKFKKWRKDSEGLTLDYRGRLIISFEGRAKIGWFHKNSSRYGQMIKQYRLPKELRNPANYRSRNKSLEALAWHPKYGVLTSAEWPLKKYHKKKTNSLCLKWKKMAL